jgi:site-specific recombinase
MAEIKDNLIELIKKCNDEHFLQKIYEMVSEHENGTDWWNALSPEQVSRVEEALAQYKAGDSSTHEQVKQELKKWRKK